MTLSHSPLWTLAELSAQVDAALAVDYPGQGNGQVREVPDIRTIRYYTTRGLLDRPIQMRGRTALYGERHLLQLVAIKRLQATGLSLTEIQPRVVGQRDAVLRRLARLPMPQPQARRADPEESKAEDRRGSAFWGATPAPVQESPEREPAEPVQESNGIDVQPLVGVPLDKGVTLLLENYHALDAREVETLRVAAAPLLEILKSLQARSTRDG